MGLPETHTFRHEETFKGGKEHLGLMLEMNAWIVGDAKRAHFIFLAGLIGFGGLGAEGWGGSHLSPAPSVPPFSPLLITLSTGLALEGHGRRSWPHTLVHTHITPENKLGMHY